MARILIVEDNEHINELYRRLLFNYEVVSAHDAYGAFYELERSRFDMLLLDMHLPTTSGLDVLAQVKKQSNYQHMIIFCVSSDDTLRIPAKDMGIDLWMTKPIDVDELLRRVREALPT